MVSIYLDLKSNYRVRLKIRSNDKSSWFVALNNIKTVPTIEWHKSKDKLDSYHFFYIYHLKKFISVCSKYRYGLYISNKVNEMYERIKLKIEYLNKLKTFTEFKSELWTEEKDLQVLDYQATAIKVCYEAKRYLEGDDLGLGKTIIALGIICKAFEDDYKKALVLCPNRLKYQWKSECLKFTKINDVEVIDMALKYLPCPKHIVEKLNLRSIECRNCELNEECRKNKFDNIYRITNQIKNNRILIFNYESLSKLENLIMKLGFDIFILDEASRIKNPQALVSKTVMKIERKMSNETIFIPMSGTLIENKLEDIYGPFSLVKHGVVGNHYNFMSNYLVRDYWGKVVGIRNEKYLRSHIVNWLIRRTIDQVWKDRPKLVELTKICPMTEKQLKIYSDARNGILKDLKEKEMQGKINAAEVGALLSYLIRICDSVESVDSSIKESGKIDVLKELLEDEIPQKDKIVIFSFFANKVIPILCREMKEFGKVESITGNVNAEEAEKIKIKFNTEEDIKFLICSDSMSYGANLQSARCVINFDLWWNPARMDQRMRRVYRKGQKHPVRVINLVTNGTVEDLILEKIGFKRRLFDDMLGSSNLALKKGLSMQDLINIIKNGGVA